MGSSVLFLRKRKKVSFALGAVALFFLADYGVGLKQQQILAEQEAKKERLENLAFHMIFPDIHDAWDVKGQPDEYEAVIKIDNVSDDVIYTTHPEIKAYVQTKFYWQEVPVRDAEGQPKEQIYRLETGQYLYRKIVTIDRNIEYVPYQMPYYMHVRFRISLYVLPESVFNEEEVIERYTDVYIYLKPFFVSDEQILAEMQWPEDKVPVNIPMPPH